MALATACLSLVSCHSCNLLRKISIEVTSIMSENGNKVKNIFVLSFCYYPDASAPSAVLNKYIQALKGKYVFHVITYTYRRGFKPLDDPYVKVYYIDDFMHRQRIKCEERCRNKDNVFNRISLQFFRAVSLLKSIVCYPLSTSWSINKYYKKLEELYPSIDADTVISIRAMVNESFAARMFKEKHSSVKWINIVTDPFTNFAAYYPMLVNKKLRHKRNWKNEIDLYNKADYTYVIEDLYDNVLSEFQQPKEKTFCMHFSLEDIRLKYPPKKERTSFDGIKLIYAGRLYKVIRNPEYMLSVISKIPSVHLDMYIMEHECDSIVDKYLSDFIKSYPGADRELYEDMICNDYDILVNIGNNTNNQSPSKMYELLSTGRPILNFYYYKDSQYDIIEKYPLGINIGRDDEDAVQIVEKFCKQMAGKQLAFGEVEKLFPLNSLKEQVAILEHLIEA